MHATTHARLIAIFNWATLIVGMPLFFLCAIASFSGNIMPVLVFMAVFLVLELILWFLPVRCAAPGCNGRMRKTATQLSTFKARLQYRCTLCDDLYEVDVFQMPPGDPIP